VSLRLFHRPSFVLGALVFLCSLICCSRAAATIRYEVSLAHPEQHLFHVAMEIPNVSVGVTIQMPAWDALYQIRDFSAHVQDVEAFAGSEGSPIEKIDKQTWKITANGTVIIRYATYWDEAGPFATQLNSEHAFINPAMILAYVPDRRAEDVKVDLREIPASWRAEAALPVLDESMGGARVINLTAPNYDALADAPVEVGKFEEFQVPGLNPPVWVVVHGDDWRKKDLQEWLRRICQYEIKLMDGAPYQRYVFFLHFGKGAGGAGGGMEHANSAAISVRSEESFLNVAAHEFFHLWNVKRIRPSSLEPVDYTKEQYTRSLWFAEGVTSTYASYTLVRTGLWSKDQFYEDLSTQISELEARPASKWQSVEQSSLDAWLEKYPQYNRPQESVSYYTKGQILGVLLDVLIRDRTDDEKSLDDVVRTLDTDFAKQGKTYRDSLDVQRTTEKVAGGSFQDFFTKYVAGTEPLPYRQILALSGLDFRTIERKRPALGFFAERDSTGAYVVRSVDPDSPAAQSGLRVGDIVVGWNGSEVPRSMDRWLYSQRPGSTVHARVKREDKEISLDFRLGEATETYYLVAESAHPSEKARRIREGLLKGTTEPVRVSVQ
jgi:predicted metalloprotease with PDZ domain